MLSDMKTCEIFRETVIILDVFTIHLLNILNENSVALRKRTGRMISSSNILVKKRFLLETGSNGLNV